MKSLSLLAGRTVYTPQHAKNCNLYIIFDLISTQVLISTHFVLCNHYLLELLIFNNFIINVNLFFRLKSVGLNLYCFPVSDPAGFETKLFHFHGDI